MDRLLAKCSDHLSLLAAPATLDQVYDFGANAFDAQIRHAAGVPRFLKRKNTQEQIVVARDPPGTTFA
jgi:Flp pilus assembly CpaE family ATPase